LPLLLRLLMVLQKCAAGTTPSATNLRTCRAAAAGQHQVAGGCKVGERKQEGSTANKGDRSLLKCAPASTQCAAPAACACTEHTSAFAAACAGRCPPPQ
jgi:hypothetical protein